MPADVADILANYDALRQQRQPNEPVWQAIADTMLPAYNDIQVYRQPGDLRTQRLMDITALVGNILLAGHMASAVTNFQMRWFALRHSLEAVNERRDVAMWLDSSGKAMQDYLASTTTPQAFHEKYLQFAGFGTGAVFSDEKMYVTPDNPSPGLLSRSVPIGRYAIAENADGAVDTFFRELELSPRQAIQAFGAEQVHPTVKTLDAQGTTRHTLSKYVHAVYPRRERDYGREDQANMAYASCYVDVARQHLCREGGYKWFPYMVSRWQKLSSTSPWGFGPGHMALPETLTLNRLDIDILRGLQFYVLPPFWSDDPEAVGRVQMIPGIVNPIAHGRTINPMRGPGDFNISHLGQEERRNRIRQVFFTNELATLPPVDKAGQMTAYEVAQRISFMQRLMGPAFMRLLSEFLNPFVDIAFGVMYAARLLPQPPDIIYMLAERGYNQIQVDYEGPLARAQRGDEIAAMDGTLSTAERIAQGTQRLDIYDNLDLDDLLRRTGKYYGAPPSIIRDPAVVAQIRQQRTQAEADAAQAEQTRQAFETGAKVLPGAAAVMRANTEREAA